MEPYETGSLWKLSIGHLGDPGTANQDNTGAKIVTETFTRRNGEALGTN